MSGSAQNNRPAAHGSIHPERMKALVMTAPWSFDDTKPNVDVAFRNKIPPKYKKDGVFHLGTGMEGLMVDVNGDWVRALFFRDKAQFPVMVPMNRVRIGAAWRSLPDKLLEQESINPNIHLSATNTRNTAIDNYIRRFWESLGQQIHRFQDLGLSGYTKRQLFGNNFTRNVNLISEGFIPQVRQLFSNGTFSLNDIAKLPQVSRQWPAPGTRVIYIILYRRQRDGSYDGVYVGQTVRHAWLRYNEHMESIEDVDNRSPHYRVGRKSDAEDRLMFPIIVWDQDVTTEVVNMAEQTMIAFFDTYHGWVLSDTFKNSEPAPHNQAVFMREVSASVRLACHLPSYNITGTNIASPIFYGKLLPMYCYHSSANSTGQRGMTTYRQARQITVGKDGARKTVFKATTSDGTTERFNVHVPQEISPEVSRMYVVFEIMHDGLPHEVPYLGCPTVGPFENFGVASSLAIAFEWFDESSNEWKRSYKRSRGFQRSFLRGVENSDVMKAIVNWRTCMDIIQLLEGINYTGTLNGFYRSLHFAATDVKELQVDHLGQRVSWRLRPRRSKPAPKLALFEDNARLLESLVRNWKTVTNLTEPPPVSSDFWRNDQGDARSVKNLPPPCDFCRYMKKQDGVPCERDPRFTDRWVCRCCAIMHRPCTWTARSHALEYWGSGEPYLVNKRGLFSLVPTGPHRQLAFHRIFPGDVKTVEVEEPIGGLEGLDLLRGAVGEEDDDGDASGDEV